MKKFFIVLAIVWGCLAIGGTALYQYETSKPNILLGYEGKEVFETVSEYSDFKRTIGQEYIKINTVKVYSSEPPIVVEFNVSIDKDFQDAIFPYGEPNIWEHTTGSSIIIVFVMLGAIAFMAVWFFTLPKEVI